MKQTNLVDQNMCKKGQEKIARKSDRFFKNKNESSVVVPIYPEK
jgi:predicted RNA binding protein YcfA (HicA-like mRNA interferase family)